MIAGVAIIGNLGFSFFMLYGMQMISGVMGSVIMSLAPAVTALGAVLFMGESINKRKIGALALGVSGVMLMHLTSGGEGSKGDGSLWIGSLLIFVAICCEAAYTLFGKVGSNQMKPITLATLSALMSGLLLVPWLGHGNGPRMRFKPLKAVIGHRLSGGVLVRWHWAHCFGIVASNRCRAISLPGSWW